MKTINNQQLTINNQSGSITPPLLIVGGVFVVVIYSLLLMLGLQLDYSHRQVASEEALYIAEAGINYYRWHLAHAPEDFRDGSEEDGPYEHEYFDPQGRKEGVFSLEIIPPADGSFIVTIKSTGWTDRYSGVKRTITAQYGKTSMTEYSFLQNASSWYGSGITVNGRIHSNNGIRMDGVNLSLVTSAKETYKCGTETGCFPPKWKPGVWGSGGDQALWSFPVPQIDFDAISFDLTTMRDAAEEEGLYLDDSGAYGYHIEFLANGTFDVSRVTKTKYYKGYSVPGQGLGQAGKGGCRKLYQRIDEEASIGTYSILDVPMVFSEDDLWVEGTINGQITVVAASFPIQSSNINIWIKDNLVYTAHDNSNSLGLIAQNDIYFARDIPEDFRIDGALIAQKGKIIRHGYFSWCGGSSEAVKDKLTINGSIISYYKSYWNFGSQPDSGFIEREINYDTNLLYAPPPYFPTSGEYEFISWTEE